MIRRIQKRIDRCDGHALVYFSHVYDFVARAHFAFLENAEIESRTATGCQQRRHSGLVRPNANAITGNSRLRDFEECASDPIPVADAHRISGQSFNCEILPELSARPQVAQVGPLQVLLPVTIRLGLVDKNGSLFTSVPGEVALAVSVEIQPGDPTAPVHWILPDRRAHGAPIPFDVAWETDVH
jgi:hypothetical protein